MKSGHVGVGSNIAQNHSFSLWEVIFAPIHMKSLPEVKLSKVIISPNSGLSTLILPQYIIFLPIFTRNYLYFPLLGFICIYYPYLTLVGHIYH